MSWLDGLGQIVGVVGEKGDKMSASARSPLATAAAVGGMAAGEMSKSARAYRKVLWDQYSKMQRGQLGMSEAQKNANMSAYAQQANVQNAQQRSALQQQAAASGSAGRSGAYTGMMQATTAQQAAAMAQARAQQDAISQQQAMMAEQDLRQRLLGQYDRTSALWTNVGQTVASGIMAGSGDDTGKEGKAGDEEVNKALDETEKETAASEYAKIQTKDTSKPNKAVN
jgi:hypothetical protein